VAIRSSIWALIGLLVVLASRALVYVFAPSQSALVAQLEHKAGGPNAVAVLVAFALSAAVLAAAVLSLAVAAVRERLALEPRELVAPPRLEPGRLALRAVALFAYSSAVFALFESYLHWRAGLGWHGLECLLGPVHRDAIPVLGGLSLLAVAVHGAVEHLLAWARRLVALFAARLPQLRGAAHTFSFETRPQSRRVESAAAPRGPPRAIALALTI
jgi:hypothetical protein